MSEFLQQPVSVSEAEQLREVLCFLRERCSSLISLSGKKVELPVAIYQLLARLVELLGHGQAIHLIPGCRVITTQSAARILGVSRTHFIKLLRAGLLPHHRVGNQRRIYLSDVLGYLCRRDGEEKVTVVGAPDE